ncbi:DEAD/DEAH box helicase [Salinicoccus halodurans]|uniref:Helicase SNF2 n=1 Tax=Salinicoccus halodurans TaxID=407035 RepID=A0A0F7HK76_9STAP|nr:DEAD/DEAH box helicase [Salinicoccus halodurans]AKG73506.1 helicase SNF2 [Salinicoccus halodurans]SFK51751.1 Superfamily II DNA or RNA helicase, SNF2 family [Salinicoccus halodurans]
MVQLTEERIRRLYSDKFFKRGKHYFQTGNVQDVIYVPEKNIWRAKVTGSRTYNTRVILNDDEIADFCDCPAYPTYGECKHICATLLAISHSQEQEKPQKSDRSFFENRSSNNPRYAKADTLIDFFGGHVTPSYNKYPLHVEYTLRSFKDASMRETFDIQLKVGENRLYVVKDIREFLEAVVTGKEVEFGTHFIYRPDYHTFSDVDMQVLNQLIDIKQTEDFYNKNTRSWMPRQKSKELTIPRSALDGLLAHLKYMNCRYKDGQFAYRQLEVSEQPVPITFSLEQPDAEEYRLKVHGVLDGTFYHMYGWYSEDGILYKMSGTQEEMLPVLQNSKGTLDRFGITISEDQIGDFISRALPGIRQMGEVSLEGDVSSQVNETPLAIKVFVDQSEMSVDVTINYHYGPVVINPLDPSGENTEQTKEILIREYPKEQAFMELLDSRSMEQSDAAFHISTDEALFRFLHDTLPDIEDYAEIYMSPALRDMLLPDPPKATVSVDAPASNDFLEVDFKMDGIDPEEIPGVLKAVREKRRFVRLPNGAFMPLEDSGLAEVAGLYDEMEQNAVTSTDGSMTLPMYRGIEIEDSLMDLDDRQSDFSSSFRDFISSIKEPSTEEIRIPGKLNADLRPYQETGFKWMKSLSAHGIGGILADDMGLGKTLQCIAYVLSEMEAGTDRPFLIVTPASLIYNWKNEFETFAPGTDVTVVSGNAAERENILRNTEQPDVYITSYHTLRHDQQYYGSMMFHALILDEAQAIKNHRTKIAHAVRSVSAPRRFALSGTPVENSVDELWSVFQAIMPGFLPDQKTFRSIPPEIIARRVKPFIMRRVKEDVLTELPDRIETVHYTDLEKDQKKLYLAYLDKIQKETEDALAGEGFNKGRMKILAGLTRLRQLCCHPSLFLDDYSGVSGKMEALFEIIGTALQNKQRMLIFSQFPSMLKIIQERLAKEGRHSYFLDGSTPSQERVRLVESFNEGQEDIFLISLKAGGTGLNLTGADTVILYDLWWNPAVEEQAIGRAHRMGQKNVVQVIRLIAQGTIEEKINGLQQQKKEMIDQIIQPGEAAASSMSEEDIREILSI